ncbi:hypothetical protein LINPERHAP2_LOCUS5486 [Linum perenne]
MAAKIEDLERSSGKRLIDGKPGMAAERGGAGGGQASIWVAASRRSLIGGGKNLGSGRMLIHGSSASNKKRKMQKLIAENQAAMQAAGDLHRKKQLEEREGERDKTDDPMARAEAEVLNQNGSS